MTLEEKALEYSLKINGFTKEDCYDENGELKQFIKSDIGIYLAGAKELEMTVGTLRTFSNEQATCIERLQKENAELELKYLQATDEGTSFAHLKSLEAQLAQAIEIIKELLDTQSQLDPYRDIFKNRILKAEQFLQDIKEPIKQQAEKSKEVKCWKCGKVLTKENVSNKMYTCYPPKYSCKDCD